VWWFNNTNIRHRFVFYHISEIFIRKYLTMWIIRKQEDKVVHFITKSGAVNLTEWTAESAGCVEISEPIDGWGTGHGMELLNVDESTLTVPEDYSGRFYKLVENGSGGYNWETNPNYNS
jgi:hypothetical protein